MISRGNIICRYRRTRYESVFLGCLDVQRDLSDAELFWIVKNGLKMTGMPSFGKTHTEEQIWGIVAFLRHLPTLSPEEHAAMVKAQKAGGSENEEQEQKGSS